MIPLVANSHTGMSVKTLGTTNAYVNLDYSVGPGRVLIALILFDNFSTASKPVVSSIAKEAGETNNWALIGAARSTSTSIGAFASGEMWAIKTTVAWSSTIYTVTLDSSVTMKATRTIEVAKLLPTLRNTVGTAYSTTTTAASATTTGTTPVIDDLAVGFLFGSNVAAVQAGDTDTTAGTWDGLTGLGSSGSSGATNNYGLNQYKTLTAATHQTFNNSAAMTAGNGSIVAIFQSEPTPAITQAAYRFYADGTEAGSTAVVAQDTAYSVDVTAGNVITQLRIRLQSTTAVAIGLGANFRLQFNINGGGWSDVAPPTGGVIEASPSANLTEGAATTNRLGAGTGTFVAGKISEATGLIDNLGWSGNNYTEVLYSLIVRSSLSHGDNIIFRVQHYASTAGLTYTQSPTISIVKTAAVARPRNIRMSSNAVQRSYTR